MTRFLGVLAAAFGGFIATSASACSLLEGLSEDDRRIIVVGQISGHRQILAEGTKDLALEIDRLSHLGGPSPETLTVIPSKGVNSLCDPVYFNDLDKIEAKFPSGKFVTVVHNGYRLGRDGPDVIRAWQTVDDRSSGYRPLAGRDFSG